MFMARGKYIVFAGMLALLMGGCASTPDETQMEMQAQQEAAKAAIEAAKAAVAEAKALGLAWRGTEGVLSQAQAAYDSGDYSKATRLANQARQEAETAINQYYLEKAKAMLAKAKGYGGLNREQASVLADAELAISNYEGKKAYDLLKGLLAELEAAVSTYKVISGDSLWRISGKDQIYGNPYQWPLIYKANRDQIKDADLIYPGQELSIQMNPSQADIDAAVNHAKTRGAWEVGVTEESDKAYLGL
jgi:nucleoid-associated protein YgaU